MGERKGQNHYYPPDFDYKIHHNLNKYHGTHALRERAKKIKEGILVIRFEMPFNVWCLGCNNHIGMGVRYNAEKKKIGMYYTTPLYEFRMRCHLCSNYFTIRTDPKNFDYEMVEGLRRQEKRFDSGELDNVAPVDRSLDQKLAADAMFKMEHGTDDRRKRYDAESQMARLESIQTRLYDDYSANCALRHAFRKEKKVINEIRAADDALKKRLSTEIALLPASKDDRIMARRILKYRDVKDFEEQQEEVKARALERPIDVDQRPGTSGAVALPLSPASSFQSDGGKSATSGRTAKAKAESLARLSARLRDGRRKAASANNGFNANVESPVTVAGTQRLGILVSSQKHRRVQDEENDDDKEIRSGDALSSLASYGSSDEADE